METKALLVLDTWATSTDFKTDLINTMKSNGLNIITDLEATDIVLALNYMTSLIYSYYKNYYLSNASKERTLELMSITTSGKLNFYASELKAYKDAYTHDFKSLGGNENSSTHDTTLNRSGKSKQATTPETIAKGSDYIDDYSSSEQKYENANTEKGTRSFNSTIKGSEQDYWKNIISIPKRLYEDIIGSFSKFFFSSSMELTPCAVLTIEQAIQKLKDEIKSLDTTTSTEINSLKSLIKINQEEIKDLKTSVDTLVTAGENTDNRVNTLDKKIGDIQRTIDKTNTNLENLTKVTPTDVAIKNKKLGLEHDNTWLTNQNAINLGDNLTYDETTKTLNAKGGLEGVLFLKLGDVISFDTLKNDLTNNKYKGFIYIENRGKIFTSYGSDVLQYTSNWYRIINDIIYLYAYRTIISKYQSGGRIDARMYTVTVRITNDGVVQGTESFSDGHIIEFDDESTKNYWRLGLGGAYASCYLIKKLNSTATPKVLQCVNDTFSWVELPKYYEHEYYEHDGTLKVGDNYITFKYIVQDGSTYSFQDVINLLDTQFIMASGMFMYNEIVENVYGIDFNSQTFMTNEILANGTLSTNEIPFSDMTLGTYTENVRLIQ